MANNIIFKNSTVADSVPSSLEPGEPAVALGTSGIAELWIGDKDGVPQLQRRRDQFKMANRWYWTTTNQWTSNAHTSFGWNQIQVNQYYGTGSLPTPIEWEGNGYPYSKGDVIKKMELRHRANHNSITDLNLYFIYVYPTTITKWNTGYNSDADLTTAVLLDTNYDTGGDNTVTATHTWRSRQVFSDLDYVCPEDGELRLYIQPIGTITSTRYSYIEIIIDALQA